MPGKNQSGTPDAADLGEQREIPNDSPRIPRSVISRMRAESEDVLSVNGERVSEGRIDAFSKSLIDLVASKKNKKILTDRINGIETAGGHTNAVLYHGEFKVLIPDSYMFDLTTRGYVIPENAAFAHIISGRLDAEVDYVIVEIDIENRIAVGNHLEAARRKQKAFFIDPGPDGQPLVKKGMIVEARVITVRRFGIFVDIFGCESFIPIKELSYSRIADAGDLFSAGEIIQVRILEIEPAADSQVKVTASVKEAIPDPRIAAMSMYKLDGLYNGRVTMIDEFGIFVALGNGAECKCEFPKDKYPSIGSVVSVRIFRKNEEEKLLWGVITRIIK